MVVSKLPGPGRPTIWMTVGQGPTALAVDGGCLDIFTLYLFSPISPSLWDTARYRLKYCLKGPLNPKQPMNQPTNITLQGHLGTNDDFAAIPFLLSAALTVLSKSISIHSTIMYSRFFFRPPHCILSVSVPCRIVFAKPEDLEMLSNHLSYVS